MINMFIEIFPKNMKDSHTAPQQWKPSSYQIQNAAARA